MSIKKPSTMMTVVKASAIIGSVALLIALLVSKNTNFDNRNKAFVDSSADLFAFDFRDWNRDGSLDLIGIKKTGTGTKSTEIHVIDGKDFGFKQFLFQNGTVLAQTTGNEFAFAVNDWDNDGKLDIFAIKRENVESKKMEIHILSGSDSYKKFSLHVATALDQVDGRNFSFMLSDWDKDGKLDLIGVKTMNTQSGNTELHVLSGASNFQKFIYHGVTGLHQNSPSEFSYDIADWDNDGKGDLIAFKKNNTGSKMTEVHILSAQSNFQKFILQTKTALHEVSDDFVLMARKVDRGDKVDLVAIKKRGTGTNTTEVHILSGESNFSQFITQTGTVLHQIENN